MAIEPVNRLALSGTGVSDAHNPEFLDKIDELIAAVNTVGGLSLSASVVTGDVTVLNGVITRCTPGTINALEAPVPAVQGNQFGLKNESDSGAAITQNQ